MGQPNKYEGSFKYRKWLAILIVMGTIAGLIVQSSRFFLGYINQDLLFQQMIISVGVFFVAVFIYKLPEPKPDIDRAKRATTIIVTLGIAAFGIPVTFFSTGFLLRAILGGPIPTGPVGDSFLVFSFMIAPFIWGFIGYFIAKAYIKHVFPSDN